MEFFRKRRNRKLLEAASKGDYRTVFNLLRDPYGLSGSNGADVDTQDERGMTPLMLAAGRGRAIVVQYLIEKRARIDTVDEYGHSPFTFAARKGHVGVVRVLIDGGVSVDGVDENGQTSLIHAVCGGHVDVVNLLIEKKASVDTEDKYKQTPLIIAAYIGNINIVESLIRAKADVTGKNGQRALKEALARKHVDVVNALCVAMEGEEKKQRKLLPQVDVTSKVRIRQSPDTEPSRGLTLRERKERVTESPSGLRVVSPPPSYEQAMSQNPYSYGRGR